jgi:hypothetical protein
VTEIPGLYFLGLPWQHTRGSALLGWVKDDARYISEQSAQHTAARTGGAAQEPTTNAGWPGPTSFEVRVDREAEPSGAPPSP